MSATGELQSATTQLEMKKVELEKVNRLFLRQHASQKELDHARGEFRIAESRVQSVKEDLEIRAVKWIDEVLDIALESAPEPLSDEEYLADAMAPSSDEAADEKNRINTH